MNFDLDFCAIGPKTLLIQWPHKINDSINEDIRYFHAKIIKDEYSLFSELVIAYNSLTIYHDKTLNQNEAIKKLKDLYRQKNNHHHYQSPATVWKIPLCYDVKFGHDLDRVSRINKLSIKQVINLHTAPLYPVYFFGFLPGFPYLGGLDPALYTPRLSTPRSMINSGSVAIGGQQTGIYPTQSPGGWNIIGRSPIELFDSSRTSPIKIKVGDKIKFTSITKDAFNEYKEGLNNTQLNNTELIND